MRFSLSIAVRALEELATTHVHARRVSHCHEFTAVMRALGARVHESFCGLGGHDYLLRIAEKRIFLECSTCGHQTQGWHIDTASQRPKPITMARKNAADLDITRARVPRPALVTGARRNNPCPTRSGCARRRDCVPAFRPGDERSPAPDNENRARRRTNDVMGRRAEHEQIQRSSPMDAHHDGTVPFLAHTGGRCGVQASPCSRCR